MRAKFHFNYACFSVATSPTCYVSKSSAAANENVMYTCSVMSVCGNINVPLTIERDGNTVESGSNTVTWTVLASNISNSIVTCMSTIHCPSVNVTGEFSIFF